MSSDSWAEFKGVRVQVAVADDSRTESVQETHKKPTPPGDHDCCESGCSPCVWDTYYEALEEWQQGQTGGDKNGAQ